MGVGRGEETLSTSGVNVTGFHCLMNSFKLLQTGILILNLKEIGKKLRLIEQKYIT